MAKKKKSAGKRAKKSSWYPKTIAFLGLFGLILAAYCYFSPQSGSIPIVAGRDYPKRTRGVPVKQTTYAVYDRLAGQSKHDATRLLPPDEVPDWNPVESEEKPAATPVQSSNAPTNTQSSSASAQSTNAAVASAGSAEKSQTPPTDKKVSTKPLMSAKPVLKPVSKSKLPVASKKNGGKNDAKTKPTASGKQTGSSLRLQIGTIQSGAEKAEKIIQNIRKKAASHPICVP